MTNEHCDRCGVAARLTESLDDVGELVEVCESCAAELRAYREREAEKKPAVPAEALPYIRRCIEIARGRAERFSRDYVERTQRGRECSVEDANYLAGRGRGASDIAAAIREEFGVKEE